MTEMKRHGPHCVELIREDLSLLGPADMKHIEACFRCRAEYEIYQRLESAMAALPGMIMPELIRKQIMAEILSPGYSLRHLLIVLVIACSSPLLLSITHLRTFFAPGLMAGIYGGSGILILLLLLPLAHYLMLRRRIDVDALKERIDGLLEKRAQ